MEYANEPHSFQGSTQIPRLSVVLPIGPDTIDESSENTLKTNTINRHRIEIETVPTFEPRQ